MSFDKQPARIAILRVVDEVPRISLASPAFPALSSVFPRTSILHIQRHCLRMILEHGELPIEGKFDCHRHNHQRTLDLTPRANSSRYQGSKRYSASCVSYGGRSLASKDIKLVSKEIDLFKQRGFTNGCHRESRHDLKSQQLRIDYVVWSGRCALCSRSPSEDFCNKQR